MPGTLAGGRLLSLGVGFPLNRLPRENSAGLVRWLVGCQFHGVVGPVIVVPSDWADVAAGKGGLVSRRVVRLPPGHSAGFLGWTCALELGMTGVLGELLVVRKWVISVIDVGGRFVRGI